MFRFARYRFNFLVDDSIHLPKFAGSALRDLFGRGLHKTVCITNLRNCEVCELKRQCVYTDLFEPQQYTGMSGIPLPIVLTLGDYTRCMRPGNSFSLELTLIGQATRHFPYLIQAWQRAGHRGLGRKNARFSLVTVDYLDLDGHRWHCVYPEADDDDNPFSAHMIKLREDCQDCTDKIRIQWLTPYRSRRDKHLVTPQTFDVRGFLITLIKRMENLRASHDPKMPALDTRQLMAATESIETSQEDLHWTDWPRLSPHQKINMHMGGVTGSFTFSGDGLKKLFPLLTLGQWVHAGKNTSFGLGRYRMSGIGSGGNGYPSVSV
jgi:hypothetical protein